MPVGRTIAVLVFGILCALAVPAQSLTRVRVGYDGFSMTSAPLDYAARAGIFATFGLDVTPAYVEGGSTLTQALVGGSVDIAQNGYTPATSAAVQGADVVIIGGIANTLPFQLVTRGSIISAQQLRGRTIAISRYGSSTDAAADLALRHLGLTRRDVTVLPLGGPSVRVAALLGGRVDATLEQQPDTGELLAHGFRVLLDVTAVARDYPNTSFATSRRYLRQHPDRVRQFLMAVATSIAEYRRHPDRAQAHIVSFLGVKDPALARVAYDAYIDVYPRDLRPSLGGLALVLDELRRTEPRAASFRPEQLVDTSALDALDRDGFFRRLH